MVADSVPRRVLLDTNGNEVAFTGAGFSAATNIAQPGNLTVGVAQVEVAITGTTKMILLTSDPTNTGRIYIGKTGVANDGSAHAFWLDPGDSAELSYDDSSNALFAIATVAAQVLSVGAIL